MCLMITRLYKSFYYQHEVYDKGRILKYSESAIYPVEPKDRVLTGVDLALLWAGSAIVVDVWYSGGYL